MFHEGFSVVCMLHYLATTIDFLATLGFFRFSCQDHRTIGTEAPDPQKGGMKHVSPILSETMDGKRKIRRKSSLYDHSNLRHADKHRKRKEDSFMLSAQYFNNSQLLEQKCLRIISFVITQV